MRLDSARPVPALFELPEAWGRFVELRGDGAVLATAARVEAGAHLRLRFTLPGGAEVSGLEGDARRSRRDADGYCEVTLLWRRSPAQVRLNRELLRLFTVS